MKKTLILASMFAFSTLVSAEEAVVAESIIPVASSFESLDLNQDGVIALDESESNAALLATFAELDLDASGDLTPAEFSKFVMVVK